MKKIMFSDLYGLTQAVIEGRKTMTRRLADPKHKYQSFKWWQPCLELDFGLYGITEDDNWEIIEPKYNLAEVVAIAQSYNSFYDDTYNPVLFPAGAGWNNKMFVKPELMPHRIHITGIKCERLQDISNADCLKEGIRQAYAESILGMYGYIDHNGTGLWFNTPREAFASLIDKISGRGTWESNPWVVAYEFKLVK